MGGSGRWLLTGMCLVACSAPEFKTLDASGGASGSAGIAGSGGFPSTGGSGGAGACFIWSGQIPLQQAVDENTCVEVQAGSYKLSAGVKVKPGHTLRGVSKEQSVLVADVDQWKFDCCDAMVSDTGPKDPTANPLRVEALTLDGAGVATYGVCCRGVTVENSVLKNARCHALGAMGTGVVARKNELLFNGQPHTLPGKGYVDCRTDNPSAIFEAAANFSTGQTDKYGSVIEENTIRGSKGPALHVEGAWEGVFKKNLVFDNGGWAAVSLYAASFWQIEDNDITHAHEMPPDPYHASCVGGPIGGKSAGIFLCQDTDANGLVTTDNQIIGNQTDGSYGILSVGADEVQKYWAPRNNTFQGNVLSGSTYGCADDFMPGQWGADDNTWTDNNCEGPANTPPGYF